MSSQHSPILSRGGEQRESREKRDGELDLMFSLAARDQDGLIPLSLNAKGLAMDDLEDELWRWMLLTKGRTVNPPGRKERKWPFAFASCGQKLKAVRRSRVSPSSSLRSAGNSTDSASDARDVRLEEAPEAKLAALLPGNLLIQ